MRINIISPSFIEADFVIRACTKVGDYEPSGYIFRCGDMYSYAITPFYPAMPFKVNKRYTNIGFAININGGWCKVDIFGGRIDGYETHDVQSVFKMIENGTIDSPMVGGFVWSRI